MPIPNPDQGENMTKDHPPEEGANANQQEIFNLEKVPTADDKLWAAIGYLIPIFAIIALNQDDKKNQPFVRYHAIQAIVFSIVLLLLILLVSVITFLVGSICTPLIWLITFWPAFDAYKGNYTRIPYVTDFIQGRGWVQH